MKYSKLMIPIAALFALSSCSPKVSGSVTSTENTNYGTSQSATSSSATSTTDDAQKANISIQAQGEAKDMKPTSAPAAAPSY